jgi:protein involved in polysaccharide export with SLBB domain
MPALVGCKLFHSGCDAIPANRLPCSLRGPSRSSLAPIDFTLLRQHPPKSYLVGPGDTIGVYIQDLLPMNREEPPVTFPPNLQMVREHFPSTGLVYAPAVGLPFVVQEHGEMVLPLVGDVQVEGLNLEELSDQIRKTYTDAKILKTGRERIMVTLMKPRIHRVMIMRDDTTAGANQFIHKEEAVFARRGSADVIDLIAYENDVLHALIATGGLPGVDARTDVWILRTREVSDSEFVAPVGQVQAGTAPHEVFESVKLNRSIIRIPLRVEPGQPLPFSEDDIVLQNGDIVYVETRLDEFFYTGGLLMGGQIPLPRDYDLDVLGALALANGSTGGPAGGIPAISNNFKGASPGNIVPPTRVIIVRTLPSGEMIRIRVNLCEAVRNPRERIVIQPGDLVLLHHTPAEYAGNLALNIMNFNFTILTTGVYPGTTPR